MFSSFYDKMIIQKAEKSNQNQFFFILNNLSKYLSSSDLFLL